MRHIIGALFALFALCLPAVPADVQIGGDPRVNPLQFRVTQFATGLNFPYSMQMLDDGSLLVGTSRPSGPSGSLFASVGELVRLVDADHDGFADGPGTVLYTGLAGPITAIRRAGPLLFVVAQFQIVVLRQGLTPDAPYSFLGGIAFGNSAATWEHLTYTLAVRPTPNTPGSYDIFLNHGSKYNWLPGGATDTFTGLISGTVNEASIYAFTVGNTGGAPVFSGFKQIAAGLRNAAGIVFHPVTGDMYFEDNGIDGLINIDEPLSVDKLNRIAAADIGNSIPDFGFPNDFINYRTGIPVTGASVQPLVVFQPIPDPFTGIPSESEGPAEIAFAPAGFPNGLNNGIFVGFHGRASAGIPNEENPLVYYDLSTGKYFHFIDNDQAVGHPDGLLSTQDSLFVADLSSKGELISSGTGVIYQIQALPVPARTGPPAPSADSVNPIAGAGVSGAFSFVFSHPNGFAELNGVKMMFSQSPDAANACLLYYDRAANAAYLTDDPGWNWSGPVLPGSPGTIQNGQCILDAGGSHASGAGNTLTLTLALTFNPAFQGTKSIYMWAIDNEGVTGPWQNRGSWTVPAPASNPAPMANSVGPNHGNGASQTFAAEFSDGNGYAELTAVYLLFNSSVYGVSACFVAYVRSSNLLYLVDDSGSSVSSPIYPGASMLQNSQCVLDGSLSQVTVSGNTLALSVALTFKNGFPGPRNIYAYAADTGGLSSGWQTLGTWTGSPDLPPSAVSVTPSNGTGANQAFAFVYSDPNGYTDLSYTYALVNSSVNAASACAVFYVRPANALYLFDDSGSSLLGPITPGSGSIGNSQCTLMGSGSSAVGSGSNLTLTLNLSFQLAFPGLRNIYGYATDAGGLSSGWQTLGTWTGSANLPPSAVSVTPANGTGANQAFTFVYSDPNGYTDLSYTYALFNSSLNAAAACAVLYSRATNVLYLFDDASSSLLGPITPGSGSVANSQCTLNGNGSSATGSGSNLTVILNLSFKPAFAGLKNIYGYALDAGNLNSGWQTLGSWTGIP